MDRRCQAIIDPERGPIIKQVFEKVTNGWSGRKVYHWLKFDLNFKTKGNKNLSLSNIYLILQNPYYHGIFEYPRKSGNWYTGKHKPLITKETFDAVQEAIKRDHVVRSEIKEFAFTKLITCGACGSGITAEEKYKKLLDGTTSRYVYYGCTRSRDSQCKEGYMKEEDLIEQLVKVMDQIDFNEIGIRHKFEEEVVRLTKFQKNFFGDASLKSEKDIDLRGYAKYLLREGSVIEKRELLACIKSKMVLTQRVVTLVK